MDHGHCDHPKPFAIVIHPLHKDSSVVTNNRNLSVANLSRDYYAVGVCLRYIQKSYFPGRTSYDLLHYLAFC